MMNLTHTQCLKYEVLMLTTMKFRCSVYSSTINNHCLNVTHSSCVDLCRYCIFPSTLASGAFHSMVLLHYDSLSAVALWMVVEALWEAAVASWEAAVALWEVGVTSLEVALALWVVAVALWEAVVAF